MSKTKKGTYWDSGRKKYVDGVYSGDAFYPNSKLLKKEITINGEQYYAWINKENGSVVSKRKKTKKNSSKTKCWLFNNTSNIAKDKDLSRELCRGNYNNIVDYFEDKSEYLQVSAGLNHSVREDVVVDIDDFFEGYDSRETFEKTEMVQKKLKNKFKILKELGLPLPSMFQIHIKNGHAQLHYILEKEIKIYNAYVDGKNVFVKEQLPYWKKYRDVLTFIAYLFDGDLMYTGWQIKNPYISDPEYINDFMTYWNVKDTFHPIVSSKTPVKTYKFDELYSIVEDYFSENADKYEKLYKTLNERKGVGMDSLFDFACKNMNCFNEKNKLFKSIPKEKRKSLAERNKTLIDHEYKGYNDEYWKSLSRNRFTREYTLKLVRDSRNNIEKNECKQRVRNQLNFMLGKFGYLDGTLKRDDYSDIEFERDFNGAYQHATSTYDENYAVWSDEDRKKSIDTKKNKKYSCIIKLLLVLLEHPNLINDNTNNNNTLCSLVGVKSRRSISNYKRELGIMPKTNYNELPDTWKLHFSKLHEYVSFCEGTIGKINKAKEKLDTKKAKVLDKKITNFGYNRENVKKILDIL